MSLKNLDKIFEPENVAVIGATDKQGSVGRSLMNNLSRRSDGEVYPVNPSRQQVLGMDAYSRVSEIPQEIDLGVVATPAKTVPGIVKECGEAGISGMIIVSAGFSETGPEGEELENQISEIRKDYGMRLLGPNCLGVINPYQDLNVTFTEQMPEEGGVTFISQSGALASSTLDWAVSAKFGFSSFVSIGNMVDIDFSDLIDYFGRDPRTESILMYIESIEDAGKFMSASRSFARTKPIMAVKSGRHEAGAEAVASHTGSLAGSDEVYDGAFKRAGITRVETIEGLFACSETLAKQSTPEGPNLTIITNAGGPGAMATDAVIDHGGRLTSLTDSTVERLEEVLPSMASLSNPVDVTGGASPEEFKRSVQIVLDDENTDGILCMHAPLGTMGPVEAAEAIADLKDEAEKPILGCWMGGERVREGKEVLRQNGFSVQSAPEQSVKAYMYLNRYARNLERLLETPEELSLGDDGSREDIESLIGEVAEEGREVLTEEESKEVLEGYGIDSPESRLVRSAGEAAEVGSEIGFPVAMKVSSSDVGHKAEVGGVALNVSSESEAEEEFERIVKDVEEAVPGAQVEGVSVQEMVYDADLELILGSKRDDVFGATIMFGKGGTDVEHYGDTAVGLPPLNQTLARHLMRETKISQRLEGDNGGDGLPPELEKDVVSLSELIIDFPEIIELDVNPLARGGEGFLALDALIRIDPDMEVERGSTEHLAIEPYPEGYVGEWEMEDGREVTIRPIKAEDEPLEFELFETFSEESWRFRFFGPIEEVDHEDMVRFTNIDYKREMAMVGILEEDGEEKMVGVGRLVTDPDRESGQYAVVVGDPWQGQGLGKKLTQEIIDFARDAGLERIECRMMDDNEKMRELVEGLGFEVEEGSRGGVQSSLKLEEFENFPEWDIVSATLELSD